MKQPRMPPALAMTPVVTPMASLPEAVAMIFGVQVLAK